MESSRDNHVISILEPEFKCYHCETEVDHNGKKWPGAINRDCVSESKSTLEKYASYRACNFDDDVCIVNIRLRTFNDQNESCRFNFTVRFFR